MSAQTVIDSLEFARSGQVLGGSVPVAQLMRLRESLRDDAGNVRFEVRGARDARGRPVLALEISGVLHLQCQRCLGTLDYSLQLSRMLGLGSEEQAAGLDEDGVEWIEPSSTLDVAELVEDEIILSLPYSPRHEEEGCRPEARITAATGASAFGQLAGLKRKSH